MMRSLHLTGQVVPNGQAGSAFDYMRIILIYDRQPNVAGTFPALNEVLQDTDNAAVNSTTARSGVNMNNAERFKIIRDLRIHSPGATLAGASTNISEAVIDYTTNRVNINEFVRLGDLETHYRSTTNPAVLADISTGSLLLMTVGLTAVATAAYDVIYTARLRFHDT